MTSKATRWIQSHADKTGENQISEFNIVFNLTKKSFLKS